MAHSGVMPMPPAISTLAAASSCSGKSWRGALISISSPTRRRSWTWREPPRLAASRATAIS